MSSAPRPTQKNESLQQEPPVWGSPTRAGPGILSNPRYSSHCSGSRILLFIQLLEWHLHFIAQAGFINAPVFSWLGGESLSQAVLLLQGF